MPTVKELAKQIYNDTYVAEKDRLYTQAVTSSKTGTVSNKKLTKIETEAQKEAIKQATVQTMRAFTS